MKPLVSVIMPTYNCAKYVDVAIESVLKQTYSNIELIIVDDHSTDETWEVVKKYEKKSGVRIFRNEKNLKLSKTLNRAIKLARGKYLARMDGDDLSLPKRLELQTEFMEKNPDVGIVGGIMEIISADGKVIGYRKYPQTDHELKKVMFRYSPFSHPLIMFRKSALDKSGYYDDSYNPAEDYELYFRVGKHSKFANLNQTLLKYRVVEKSMTTGTTKQMELQTIRARNKFSNSYPYKMSLTDRTYNLLQYISVFIIPARLKIGLFGAWRNVKKI